MFLRISVIDVAIGHNLKVKMISAGNGELFTSTKKFLYLVSNMKRRKCFINKMYSRTPKSNIKKSLNRMNW
jgi:hypothetical protein